LSPIPRG